MIHSKYVWACQIDSWGMWHWRFHATRLSWSHTWPPWPLPFTLAPGWTLKATATWHVSAQDLLRRFVQLGRSGNNVKTTWKPCGNQRDWTGHLDIGQVLPWPCADYQAGHLHQWLINKSQHTMGLMNMLLGSAEDEYFQKSWYHGKIRSALLALPERCSRHRSWHGVRNRVFCCSCAGAGFVLPCVFRISVGRCSTICQSLTAGPTHQHIQRITPLQIVERFDSWYAQLSKPSAAASPSLEFPATFEQNALTSPTALQGARSTNLCASLGGTLTTAGSGGSKYC